MLNRITLVVLGLMVIVAIAAVTVFYLAYDAGPAVPAVLRSDLVENETAVRIFEDGSADIVAASAEDAITALGFTHASSRAWSMFLWRQAALGRSGEWFGERAVPADRFVRRLGLASLAEQAFTDLPDSTRAWLIAYTEGVNAALFEAGVERSAPFVLEQITPEPWQPWHSLAVERLLAWTGTPLTDTSADLELRRMLRTYGFEYNVAAWVADAEVPYVYSRMVTGDSGIPLFQDVQIRIGESVSAGPTLPGAPVMTSGMHAASSGPSTVRAWSSLLASSHERSYSNLRPSDFGSVRYERVETREAEFDVRIVESDDGRVLVPGSVEDENVYRTIIRWSGRTRPTDITLWRDYLLRGRSDIKPGLFDAGLLAVDAEGDAITTGRPAFVLRDDDGNVFIASVAGDSAARSMTPLDRYEQLVTTSDVAAGAGAVLLDDTSPPREQLSQRLLGLMPQQDLFRLALDPDRLGEALSYLRNWNGSYSGAEIAPSLLEAYLAVGEIRAGVADTTSGEAASRLLAALDSLSVRFGSDMSSWRWQRVQNRRMHFPGAVFAGSRLSGRFESVPVEFEGHSSTFTWGPQSLSLGSRRPAVPGPSAAWEGVLIPSAFRIDRRRPSIDWIHFLGAYLSSRRSLDPRPFPDPAAVDATVLTLLPRSSDLP